MLACGRINVPTVTLCAAGMASGTRAARPVDLPTQLQLCKATAVDTRQRYRVERSITSQKNIGTHLWQGRLRRGAGAGVTTCGGEV